MKKILLLLILTTISCKTFNHKKSDCNENTEFKKMFFYHTKYIENNIAVQQDSTFRASVIFVSNYASVSTDQILNYASTYPIGIYEQDSIKWVEWYEKNKCTNIQFKNTYIIPAAYSND